MASNTWQSINWKDPFLLEQQLSDDQRMVRDTAHQFAQEKLLPRVREAFRVKGHHAFSCDIIPSSDNSPNHIQKDVLEVLEYGWDLMIAHPPCTYLSRAGARWLYPKAGQLDNERYEKLLAGREFFMTLLNSDIPKIAVENPTPFKIAKLPKPSQVIQPFQFGDPYSKKTCLWLKNLSPLKHYSQNQKLETILK